MIRVHLLPALLAGVLLGSAGGACAASLTVSPILLSVGAPATGATLTVRNDSDRAMTVQVRVFRWRVDGKADSYAETRDVVVSPPISTIAAKGDLQVRVMRVSGAPVQGEETYRVVVDEVPDANRVRNVGVNVALRYTLPLFFIDPNASQPRLTWSIRRAGARRVLVATNSGDKHVRLANLTLGKAMLKKGLAGYVLGRSERVFDLPAQFPAGGPISADTGEGKLSATLGR